MLDDLIERLDTWAREDGDFSNAVGPEYIEGFRDAQECVRGLIRAWHEPADAGASFINASQPEEES